MLGPRSEEHTSELQSRPHLVCRLLLEKKKSFFFTLMSSIFFSISIITGRTLIFVRYTREPTFSYDATATSEIYTLSLHDALPIFLIAAEPFLCAFNQWV